MLVTSIIKVKMTDECIFCKIVKGEIKVDLIYENDNQIEQILFAPATS